jgi:hypothetical protein
MGSDYAQKKKSRIQELRLRKDGGTATDAELRELEELLASTSRTR